jgi:hypothetical protein
LFGGWAAVGCVHLVIGADVARDYHAVVVHITIPGTPWVAMFVGETHGGITREGESNQADER